jgi:hypothetical protein
MRLKSTVQLHGLTPQAVLAMLVADEVYEANGFELIVTSCNDLEHSPKSLHQHGRAFDSRVRHIADHDVRERIRQEISQKLPGFDVLLEEYPDHPDNDHIHVEWDPIT